MSQQEIQDLIDQSVSIAINRHNRNASMVSAALGFVFKSITDFFSWYNNQTPEMKQKLQDLLDTQASTQGAFGTYDAAELASIAGQR